MWGASFARSGGLVSGLFFDHLRISATMCLPRRVHGCFLSQEHFNVLNWTLCSALECPGRYEDDLLHLIDKGIRECEDKAAWQRLADDVLDILGDVFYRFVYHDISCSATCVCVCMPFEPFPFAAINAYDLWGGARKAQAQSLAHVDTQRQVDLFCSWYLLWLDSKWLTYLSCRNHQLDPVSSSPYQRLFAPRHAEGIAVMIDQEQLWKFPEYPVAGVAGTQCCEP